MNVTVPCPCPGTPHPGGDTITLRDVLDFQGALATRNAILVLKRDDPESGEADSLAVLAEYALLYGITAWTLVDEKKEAIEVSRGAIRANLLSRPEIAMAVSDAAAPVYQDQVMAPLEQWVARLSPPSPTDGSTSATNGSAPKRPKPSSPSSTTTTPTADIETTTPALAGASSSSRN